MAKSVTLLQLRTRVRQRADIEAAVTRHPDAELNDNLNQSIEELYDMLRAAFGQSYYRAQSQFSTSAGNDIYGLPNDFLSLVSVDIYLGNNINGPRYSATPFMESERNIYSGFGAWTIFGRPVAYHLFGNNIRFIPIPSAAALVQLNYVPVASVLVGDADTFDGVSGWEEYVVLDAAIKSLIKDDGFEKVGVLEGRKAAIAQRITSLALERDSGQGGHVSDVLRSTNTYPRPMGGGGDFGGPGW